jgi:phage-related baseplate assembly protein
MSHDTALDLSVLPPPEVIETVSYEPIVTLMRDIAGVIDLESEPARKLIEVFAYREILLRARANDVARANLLAFATGADLDHLAAWYDVTRLANESDARLRSRIILAIRGRSTGGTEPRYRFVALSASSRVADAVVWRDGLTPVVRCAIYATDNNGVPDAGLIATVAGHLTAADVRMVNDTIAVSAAVQKLQNITAQLTLLPNTSESILADVEAALRADWLAERRLGFDMTLSWITSRLMRAGIYKAAITVPAADVIARPSEAISVGTVTLTVAGRDF